MLKLYAHPLASFCHKVLIALYEAETAFEMLQVDLLDHEEAKAFAEVWPVGKMPVLRDDSRDVTLPETSIIIEYLDQHYPGAQPLLPADAVLRLDVRLWDRFYDLYVQQPMQKIVVDRLRPEGARDAFGVTAARHDLQTAYGLIESEMLRKTFAAGDSFTMADCAAAPALFFAGIVEPFPESSVATRAYLERLLARPSVGRVITEARPYFEYFPYRERMPERFLRP